MKEGITRYSNQRGQSTDRRNLTTTMPSSVLTVEDITKGWRHEPKPITDINVVSTAHVLIKDLHGNLRISSLECVSSACIAGTL